MPWVKRVLVLFLLFATVSAARGFQTKTNVNAFSSPTEVCGTGPFVLLNFCKNKFITVSLSEQMPGYVWFTLPRSKERGQILSTRVHLILHAGEGNREYVAGLSLVWGKERRSLRALVESPDRQEIMEWSDHPQSDICLVNDKDEQLGCTSSWQGDEPAVVNELVYTRRNGGIFVPPIHPAGAGMVITGLFTGRIQETHVFIDSNEAKILAESETDMLVAAPTELGRHWVTVEQSGSEVAKQQVQVVRFDFDPSKISSEDRRWHPIRINISGLSGLAEPLAIFLWTQHSIELRNVRPIKFPDTYHLRLNTTYNKRAASGIGGETMLVVIDQGGISQSGESGFTFEMRSRPGGVQPLKYFNGRIGNVTSDDLYNGWPSLSARPDSVTFSRISDTVKQAIQDWQSYNSARITKTAAAAIVSEFDDKSGRRLLADNFTGYWDVIRDFQAFVDLAARFYLYSLRDYAAGTSKGGTASPATLVSHFAQNTQPPIGPPTITDDLVRRLPISQVFRSLIFRAMLHDGVIEVQSEPEGMKLTVDSEQWSEVTNRFVELPVTTHTIQLQSPDAGCTCKVVIELPGPRAKPLQCGRVPHISPECERKER
jgi:hypothetical protein